MSEKLNNKPWWKQLWPWLIISGPAVGAIAAGFTVWIAFTQDVDQPIHEGVIKQGLKVEQVRK